MFRTITRRRKEDVRKTVKIADLGNFEVWSFAPCYKHQIVCEPDYFIDDYTGEKIGQELKLLVFPDGTFEPIHHSLFIAELNKTIKLSLDDISDTIFYRNKKVEVTKDE